MPEDDLGSIGLLRARVVACETMLADFGRRIAMLEGRDRSVPRAREPMRGTGSARDPDLAQYQQQDMAEAEQRRQQAYDEANQRHPLPLSGTKEVEPKEE